MAAYNRVCALFLIALLFSASNPVAQAQLIPPITPPIRGISLNGTICCTPAGSCPGQGAAEVVVSLNCTILGTTVTIGQGTTNVNGTFNITVPTVLGLITGLPFIPCVAAVNLPLSPLVCPVLSTTTGVLASALRTIGTVIDPVLGLLQRVALVGFVNVGI